MNASGGYKTRLKWFQRNLDLLLSDLTFEKGGAEVNLYFDSRDVRDAVLGMQAFYTPGIGFDVASFEEKRVLVQCLATSGWLGKIRMLPSHEAEFKRLLDLDFGIGIEVDPMERMRQFLKAVDIAGTAEEWARAYDSLYPENLLEFVKKHAGSAMRFFKVIQCIRGVWHSRLINFTNNNILLLEKESFDYSEVTRSRSFQTLHDIYQRMRPKRTVNNFADAFAIALLTLRVEALQRGEPRSIPRFFASTSLISDVVQQAGLSSLLYPDDGKESVSVLRDSDYLIFKAIFTPQLSDTEDGIKRELDLKALSSAIAELLQTKHPLDEKVLETIRISNRSLATILDDLKDLSFFGNVWLPVAAKKEFQIALRELGESSRRLTSEALRRSVEEALRSTRETLESSVQQYKRFMNFWTKLDEGSRAMRASALRDRSEVFDVFWDLGLLRFGFPERAHPKIRNLVEALLSDEEETERSARIYLIDLYNGLALEGDEGNDDLMVVAAVLWVISMDSILIDLIERIGHPPHYSLQIIHVASILRLGRKLDRGEKILTDIERYYAIAPQGERAHLAVGIAYLSFHLWARLERRFEWRSRPEREVSQVGREHIDKAIRYVREALVNLDVLDERKRVYVLNQNLYYLVEGGDANAREEMIQVARELIAYKSIPYCWQYRFDDTVARYFHRLALFARSKGEQMTLLENARIHLKAAFEGPYRDPELVAYQSLLEIDIATVAALKES
ncbi:MAG TPA: hypothetical protein VLX28_09195 [Thermoanaerobaculia bacterium]|nr:hypothetical protein [Thermoanaerobaculia bacterium]